MATPGKFPAGVVELMVNGVVHRIDAAMARERKIDGKFTVVAFLREVLELKGTKLGCGVGGCGVCTVMLTRPVFTGRPQTAAQTETVMVNSCLLPLFAVHQCAITTVEGVGTSAAPHPIQVAIAESHGTQCGFCTPGMVMSLYTTLAAERSPSLADLERSFDGNLCRCTGYRPLLDAAKSFAADFDAPWFQCSGANGYSEPPPVSAGVPTVVVSTTAQKRGQVQTVTPPTLPAEWLVEASPTTGPACTAGNASALAAGSPDVEEVLDGAIVRPTTLSSLLELRVSRPTLLPFQGAIDGGGLTGDAPYASAWLDPSFVPSLRRVTRTPTLDVGWSVGTHVSISQFAALLTREIAQAKLGVEFEKPSESVSEPRAATADGSSATRSKQTRGAVTTERNAVHSGYAALLQQIGSFGTPQARNGGVVGSLLWSADLRPVLAAVRVNAVIGRGGPLDRQGYSGTNEDGFHNARFRRALVAELSSRRDLGADEYIVAIELPPLGPAQGECPRVVLPFKQGLGTVIENREIASMCVVIMFEPSGATVELGSPTATTAATLEPPSTIASAELWLGGVARLAVRCPDVEAALVGRPFTLAAVEAALPALMAAVPLDATSWGGRPEWRRALYSSFLHRASAMLSQREPSVDTCTSEPGTATAIAVTVGTSTAAASTADTTDHTAARGVLRPAVSTAVQTFELSSTAKLSTTLDSQFCSGTGDHVQGPRPDMPLKHLRANASHEPYVFVERPRGSVGTTQKQTVALPHATGESKFADDTPLPAGGLYAGFVNSTIPHGRIVSIDPTAAVAVPGVRGYYDVRDFAQFRGKCTPPSAHDDFRLPQEVTAVGPPPKRPGPLAVHWVTCLHQGIGVVVADTLAVARSAARLVVVTYSPAPAIFTIDEAIAAESFLSYDHAVTYGDVDTAIAAAEHVVEGELTIGGQEHWYTEPHALTVVPGEDDEITVITCTQCVMKTQKVVAEALGIPSAKVVVKVKRIGGAFGGKEVLSVHLAATAAVAARRLRRSVRVLLTRQEDMQRSGQRHPFLFKYKAAFAACGKLLALDATLYNNGGHTDSVTKEVMDRAIFHAANAYTVPHYRVRGRCCKTNLPDFTAFRGFGATQVMFMSETIIEEGARMCGLSAAVVRGANLVPSGYRTPYGQLVPESHLPRLWAALMLKADHDSRREALTAFNRTSKWVKRGMTVIPTMYGINFPVSMLNAVGALAMVYTDGTVLVAHGGTEMGQGLNTKMAQVAADAFGIEVDRVHVADCSSDKVPNNPPTAASYGSDLNGMAVLNACERIMARLAPLRDLHLGKLDDFAALAEAAYYERVSLMAEGFYAPPRGAEYDWDPTIVDNADRGDVWNYFAFGAEVAEVEVDTLTGQWHARRCDVVMDVGQTLNAAIDIGQIEGAFTQGMGLGTTEELIWADVQHPWLPSQDGALFNAGPQYKCPTAADVPSDFRVHLLRDSICESAVHSSKAVGEPPTFLGGSVFFAIRDAIAACRAERGLPGDFRLDVPATYERIRMACGDSCTAAAVRGGDPDARFQAKGSY